MAALFREKIGEFRDFGRDADLASAIERHVAAHTGVLADCRVPVLCHDDFHPGDIIVTGSYGGWRLTGVVDVENAVAGDPLLDLAKTLLYAVGENKTKRGGLLDGYGGIDRPDWEQAVELYQLYHALEWWDWAALIGASKPPWLIEVIKRIASH